MSSLEYTLATSGSGANSSINKSLYPSLGTSRYYGPYTVTPNYPAPRGGVVATQNIKSVNDPSKKISAIPKGLLWTVIIITILIIVIWAAVLIYAYMRKTLFFNYTRPGTLPGQDGATLTPTKTGYDLPSVLTDKTIFLGGEVNELNPDAQQARAKQANAEFTAWNNWHPVVPNPNTTPAQLASNYFF